MAPSQRSGPAASRRSNACGIVLAQRGNRARHPLVGAEPGRVHAEVSLTVMRLAAAIELLDLGGGAARQHRPVAAPRGAGVELGQLAPQPDNRAERAQRLHAAVAAGKATTRRDDVTGLEPQQRSEEHTSELQSQSNLVCRLLLEKKKQRNTTI